MKQQLLEEEVRGLKKKLKASAKASENNHNGMMYWRARALKVESGVKIISTWINQNNLGS